MKISIKNIAYIFVAATIASMAFFVMANTAAAGASLSGGSHPTLRAANYTDCPGCVNWYDEGATFASADAGEEVSLGIYYKNTGNSTAYDVRIKLSPQNSSSSTNHSFSATVSASNANSRTGSANVSISSSQTLEFDGHIDLFTNPSNSPVSEGSANSLFGSGMVIGDVPAGHEGLLVARFDVSEDTVSNNEINVLTQNASGVDSDSARLNGYVSAGNNIDVWFVIDDNDSTPACSSSSIRENVSGTFSAGDDFDRTVTGLQDNTRYYFRACGEAQDGTTDSGTVYSFTTDSDNNGGDQEPDVTTESATNVDEDDEEATLNGEYDMNDYDGVVFFAWSDNSSDLDINDIENENDVNDVEDMSGVNVEIVDNNAQSGDRGDARETIDNLDIDETHYFALCVEFDNEIKCGSRKSFDFDDNSGDLNVTTDAATSVDENDATLNGEYEDADDADVFFVWGEDEDDIDDVADENEIDDIRDKSKYNDVEIEIVEYSADGDDRSVSENIDGLRRDTEYFFRLCLEQDNDLECGRVRSFTTDEDRGSDDIASVGQCTVSFPGTTTATLRGSYDSDSSVDWHFEYGTSSSTTLSTDERSGSSGNRSVTQFVQGLSPNTLYYCELVVENDGGEATGDLGTFRTRALTVLPPYVPPTTPVTPTPSSGPGALVILEIDDNQETATRGEILTYEVTWNNVSNRDLDEVALFIQLPRAARFISTTEGTYNRRDHAVYNPLGRLDADEDGEMTITVRVGSARAGEPIVAEAVLAFENPEEGNAFLNAIELDADTYNAVGLGLTAGLFGMGLPTTLLGWLILLLVLILVILGIRHFILNDRDRRRRRRYTQAPTPTPQSYNNDNQY